MNDELPSFAQLFEGMISEGESIRITYSHTVEGFKDESYTAFRVEALNGCASPLEFRDRLRMLVKQPLRRLTEIAHTNYGSTDVSDYFQRVADDCDELSYLVFDDEQVFEENEYGQREVHPYKRFHEVTFKGDMDSQLKWHENSVHRKAADFAEIWLSVIAETRQRILTISSQVDAMAISVQLGSRRLPEIEFVAADRMKELGAVASSNHDLTRLCRLLQELNMAYKSEMFFATAMLLRAILDHIPPVFGKMTFAEVCGSYSTRSFREAMSHLDKSLRKIADQHLHTPVRCQEVLPTASQVNFSQSLDVLLGEICRIMKMPKE